MALKRAKCDPNDLILHFKSIDVNFSDYVWLCYSSVAKGRGYTPQWYVDKNAE